MIFPSIQDGLNGDYFNESKSDTYNFIDHLKENNPFSCIKQNI